VATTFTQRMDASPQSRIEIVGHEKAARITYGRYSGGATLKEKAEAIERVKYPLGRVKLV